MKCSRCGEECKAGQLFCYKCGTPIQVEADFDDMEDELAISVGQFMNENKESDNNLKVTQEFDYLDDEDYEDDFDLSGNIELVDINEDDNAGTFEGFNVDASSVPKQKPEKIIRAEQELSDSEDTDEEILQEKKVFKIKAIGFSIVAVIVIAIAIIILKSYSANNASNHDFVKLYNAGVEYYSDKEYDNAVNSLLKAKEYAESKSEKIKVNSTLRDCYKNMEGSDMELIKVLKELIELEPSKEENYQELISIYGSNNMTDEMNELLDSIKDSRVKSSLAEYMVAVPNFSEDSGDFNNNVTLKLTTNGSNKIYYTTDGSEPTTSSTLYTDVINLDTAGTITVKAIAVNQQGVSSKVESKVYHIKTAYTNAPVVTPEGGLYDKQTDIVVEVPDGMKCYYTYGQNAITPTTGDKEYTGPVKMLRGKNIFCAILVSEDGATISDTAQMVYQLTINSVLTYDDAEAILKSYVEGKEIAVRTLVETGNVKEDGTPETEEQYLTPEGNTISFEYSEIALIDNEEYYIIDATERTQTGSRVNIIHYGIDTVTGELETVERDALDTSKYVVKPEEEETTAENSSESNTQ